MSISIGWGTTPEESGLIYLDSTTLYVQDYSGKVTSHPVDTGGAIVDHYIRDNPKFTISGVITSVDLSTGSFLISNNAGNFANNTNIASTPVSVNSIDRSLLNRFIPSSIGQFLPDSTPDVFMDSGIDAQQNLLEQIRDLLVNLMSGQKFNEKTGQYDSNIEVLTLYEYEGTSLIRSRPNIVMTRISFDERPDTGRALYCNMSFEQVTFVTLKKTEIPKSVLDKKASSKAAKGKGDSTVKDSANPPDREASPNAAAQDVDPLRGGVSNNG